MVLENIFLVMLLFIPYSIIGEGFGSAILTFAGGILLIKSASKSVVLTTLEKNLIHSEVNKVIFYLLLALSGFGVISLIFTNNLVSSLLGLTIYVNAALFYLVFKKLKHNKYKIIQNITYLISISSLIFLLYEGVLLKNRIDGNFGYANTYGLVLLIGLYLNEIIDSKFHKNIHEFIQIVLILGIIYTGSRNSFVYLLLFIILDNLTEFIKNKDKNKHSNIITTIKTKSKRTKEEIKSKDKLCNEHKMQSTSFISFFIALGIYVLFNYLGFMIIFVLPIILYLIYLIFNKLQLKVKRYISIIFGIIIVSGFMFIDSKFLSRFKDISLKTGVLQERFVFFQDAFMKIIKNPLGNGINSFEYSQYAHQSAFYDVRYIHNSVLQVGYDLGIVAMIIFTIFIFYGAIYIYKSKDENKTYYLFLYLTMFFHSLLDFDFSYSPILIILVMIVAFVECSEENKDNNILKITNKCSIFVAIPILIFSIYLIIVNSIVFIGDKFTQQGKYDNAKKIYTLSSKITFKNPDIYLRLSSIYNEQSKTYSNEEQIRESLNNCIINLEKANEINPKDPRIIGNLAFVNQKMKNNKNTIRYYNEFLNNEKFYYEIYQLYYEYLIEQSKETQDEIYKQEILKLQEIYNKNLKLLNPKAKYMKDQMVNSFYEMLKMEEN